MPAHDHQESDQEKELQLIRESFILESQEGLSQAESRLLLLEKEPDDEAALQDILRVLHTIKGNASSLGYSQVAEMSHAVEEVLIQFREGALRIDKGLTSVLLEAVDSLREMVRGDPAGSKKFSPTLLKRLGKIAASKSGKSAKRAEPAAPASSEPPPSAETAETKDSAGASDSSLRAKSLRVGMEKMNGLLNMMGELVIAEERLKQMLESRLVSGESADIFEAFSHTQKLCFELHERVSKLRMVPIGDMLRSHARTVRDLSEKFGKPVLFEVEGGEAEVDSVMIDHLRDPLVHMIRNAMDHGIETPEARASAGKDPAGRIAIRAYHEGSDIIVEIIDDGAGFNKGKILAKAMTMGLIQAGEELPDSEIYRLTFHPGFTTASKVTDTSGRGVGMDVVLKNIESMHGRVSIKSLQGRGTTIVIRLPLTLAIIDGFAVGVRGNTYVIPLNVVSECLRMPRDEKPREDARGIIHLRGETLPFLRLRKHFWSVSPPPRSRRAWSSSRIRRCAWGWWSTPSTARSRP